MVIGEMKISSCLVGGRPKVADNTSRVCGSVDKDFTDAMEEISFNIQHDKGRNG